MASIVCSIQPLNAVPEYIPPEEAGCFDPLTPCNPCPPIGVVLTWPQRGDYGFDPGEVLEDPGHSIWVKGLTLWNWETG